MTDSDIKRILISSKVIAAVGASDNAARPSFGVMKYLLRNGYAVVPVNPNYASVLGIPTEASLADVPGPVDVVLIFRRPDDVPAVVDEALARDDAAVIWMQDGAGNEGAAATARAAGRTVVVDDCMMRQHRRLIGDRMP